MKEKRCENLSGKNVQYLNRQKYDDLCQGAIDIE